MPESLVKRGQLADMIAALLRDERIEAQSGVVLFGVDPTGLTLLPVATDSNRRLIVNTTLTRDTFSTAQITIGATATIALTKNAKRVSYIIVNNSSVTIFVGASASVTTSTGLPLAAGQALSMDNYTGEVWGVVATGTATLSVLET